MRLALAIVTVLAVGCGQKAASPSTPPPPAATGDRKSCSVAEDCVLVDACCGCSAGGRRVSIRKDAVAEYEATRAQRCGDSACTAVMSNHSSCDAEATCENGECGVVGHMGGLP